MRALIAIAGLMLCHAAGAQMFKCADKAGKITYSSQACIELGLKDAGEVKDRLQITPAPPPSTRPAAPASSSSEGTQAPVQPAAEDPAKKSDRRCFTTKSGTRCNDGSE